MASSALQIPFLELLRRSAEWTQLVDGRARGREAERRKRFGQHFLEPAWVRKVVDVIAPGTDGTMLEIGPGGGALTLALAPRVSRLVAVEIDRDLADALEPRLPPHVTLVRGDFLKMDLAALCATLPRPVRVVGNLPYNISSPILFR